MAKKPVVIDLEHGEIPSVLDAAPLPDLNMAAPTGQAMQATIRLASRRPSRLARGFWGLLLTLLGAVVSVAAWDFATGLLTRWPIVGWGVVAVIGALLCVLLAIALKELAGFARLRRIDGLRDDAQAALRAADISQARKVVSNLQRLYASREDTSWGRQRLKDQQSDILDADALLALAETEVLGPLDAAVTLEIEAAARQVATVTALVPLALVDVFTALTANIRMIRRIAEIYGGRAGTLGSWRLLRAVMTHLVATGAVAVGDDMLGSLAGGSLLGKLSRRFGEGIVNGALTARVGVAAVEVCRPMPFVAAKRPSVTKLVKNALTGLFGSQG